MRTRSGRRKIFFVVVVVVVCVLLLVPYLFGRPKGEVVLNQHYIEGVNREYGTASFAEAVRSAVSFYTFLLASMQGQDSGGVEFDDAEEMFGYVFGHLPYYAIVYPTERYYYYLFSIRGVKVSGNIRLVDVDEGRVGIGWFERERTSRFGSGYFGVEEGLEIRKVSEVVYRLTYQGKSVWFRFSDDIVDDAPRWLQLLPEEVFVGRVRDESGVVVLLVFNDAVDQFYYVLDEDRAVADTLQDVGGDVMVGERTGFAFFADPAYNRKVLVGVDAWNVQQNNYFDGPFDQVYPFWDLREMIYKAYPYTQLGGVDKFGNLLIVNATRVAITPYQRYYHVEDVKVLVRGCKENRFSGSAMWGCVAYDEKKNFHKESPLFYANGTLKPGRVAPRL